MHSSILHHMTNEEQEDTCSQTDLFSNCDNNADSSDDPSGDTDSEVVVICGMKCVKRGRVYFTIE